MRVSIGIAVVVGVLGIAILILLNDSRFNLAVYECDKNQKLTLSPNSLGGVHWAEAYLGGWVDAGSVTVTAFPDHRPGDLPPSSVSYTSENHVSASYVGEMYGSPIVQLAPSEDARCHLRIIYRLKSDLSLVNPLW